MSFPYLFFPFFSRYEIWIPLLTVADIVIRHYRTFIEAFHDHGHYFHLLFPFSSLPVFPSVYFYLSGIFFPNTGRRRRGWRIPIFYSRCDFMHTGS